MTILKEKRLKCPRCGARYFPELAELSRRDNKTKICNDCGTLEALEDNDMREPYTGEPYWKQVK